jgi:NADH-quinone oxidoreductase subunit G
VSPGLLEAADLLLPIGTFAETSGTYVNVEGRVQSFAGVANPVGESRPGWKVLRVLGNLLEADGFDYASSEDVRAEVLQLIGEVRPPEPFVAAGSYSVRAGADAPAAEIDIPIYSVDGLVRRAAALQLTPEAKRTAGGGS